MQDASEGGETARHGRYILSDVPPWIEVRRASSLFAMLLHLIGRRPDPELRLTADAVEAVETFRKRLWGFQSKRPASARPWTVEIAERGGRRHRLAFVRQDQAQAFANALRRLVADRRHPPTDDASGD